MFVQLFFSIRPIFYSSLSLSQHHWQHILYYWLIHVLQSQNMMKNSEKFQLTWFSLIHHISFIICGFFKSIIFIPFKVESKKKTNPPIELLFVGMPVLVSQQKSAQFFCGCCCCRCCFVHLKTFNYALLIVEMLFPLQYLNSDYVLNPCSQ